MGQRTHQLLPQPKLLNSLQNQSHCLHHLQERINAIIKQSNFQCLKRAIRNKKREVPTTTAQLITCTQRLRSPTIGLVMAGQKTDSHPSIFSTSIFDCPTHLPSVSNYWEMRNFCGEGVVKQRSRGKGSEMGKMEPFKYYISFFPYKLHLSLFCSFV